jgi:hypothetical protein
VVTQHIFPEIMHDPNRGKTDLPKMWAISVIFKITAPSKLSPDGGISPSLVTLMAINKIGT